MVDLGYIPPIGGHFGKIDKLLVGLGWNVRLDSAIGIRGGRYRKGDVELMVDDTMLAIFVNVHPTGQTRRVVDEAIGGISDYRKGAGTGCLASAVGEEHRKRVTVSGATDWRSKAAGEMMDMLDRRRSWRPRLCNGRYGFSPTGTSCYSGHVSRDGALRPCWATSPRSDGRRWLRLSIHWSRISTRVS